MNLRTFHHRDAEYAENGAFCLSGDNDKQKRSLSGLGALSVFAARPVEYRLDRGGAVRPKGYSTGRGTLGFRSESSLLSTFVWILAVLVLAGVYVPVIRELVHVWRTNTYAIHGMFVPFFSALILWNERESLREAKGPGSLAGLLVILFGLGVLVLGKWAESLIIQGLSIPVCVAGLVLWGFGGRLLKAAAFPISFLIFMVPPPALLIASVTLHLQLFAAAFAGSALRLLDVPYFQNGVVIELPTMTLKIAEICNGLRFLFALLVLAIAFAQVTQRSLTHKLLLVLSAIPFAILANWVRVAVIVVGVHYVGPEVASGFIHHSIGKVVWALTLIPLVALGLAMRREKSSRAKTPSPQRVLTAE